MLRRFLFIDVGYGCVILLSQTQYAVEREKTMLASPAGGLQALEKVLFVRCQCPSGKCMGRVEATDELEALTQDFVLIVENCLFFRPEEGDEVYSLESGFKIWKLVRPERARGRVAEMSLVARPQTVLAFVKDDPFTTPTKQLPLMWSLEGKRKTPPVSHGFKQLSFTFWPAKV